MRAVDTNVLLRLHLMDDERHGAAVTRFVRRRQKVNEPIFVSLVVLCEVAWVLRRTYRFDRSEVAEVLNGLLDTDLIIVEQADLVREAIALYGEGPGDFADHVIGLVGQAAGCRDTVTFDRALRTVHGFTQLR